MALCYANIGGMRKAYGDNHTVFSEDHITSMEPIGQFKTWFEEACKSKDIEANAMCLATADKNGFPSARIVLLKGYGKEGFTFYTKYTSRKGQELEENSNASLCFFWEPLKQSVRVEGTVSRVPEVASSEYFASRPRPSQVAAIMSCALPPVISSRAQMSEKVDQVTKKYEGMDIPKPAEWGGYLVTPLCVEFWQGQTDRTHDRIRFRRKGENETLDPETSREGIDGWVVERLCP